jgi:hypothetical protein
MSTRNSAVTLLELLIALVLLTIVVLGFVSIESFSRYQVLSSERRTALQNEVSLALDHISKNIFSAFGNTRIDPVNQPAGNDVVDIAVCGTDPAVDNFVALTVYVEDVNQDHRPTFLVDRRIAYMFDRSLHTLKFINNYTGGCSSALPGDTLSSRITAFVPVFAMDAAGNYPNHIDLQITACWDPTEANHACGTSDNPSVTMNSRAVMPSVSTR